MLNWAIIRNFGPLLWLLAALPAAAVRADGEHNDNVGQSIAHPLSRFDLRFKYEQFRGGDQAEIMEARLERPFDLPNAWKLNTRVSMTGWVSDLPSADNPDGGTVVGTGDLQTQLFFIAPPVGATTIGFGWRNYFPLASADQFGKGAYRMAPLLVVQRQASWLPAGSFFGLGVRNDFSISADRAHPKVNELQIVPIVTVLLPHQSFVTLFPEIVIDWEHDNHAFVPFDFEVGRKYASDRAASIRLQVPLVNQTHAYEWAVEARWSWFF